MSLFLPIFLCLPTKRWYLSLQISPCLVHALKRPKDRWEKLCSFYSVFILQNELQEFFLYAILNNSYWSKYSFQNIRFSFQLWLFAVFPMKYVIFPLFPVCTDIQVCLSWCERLWKALKYTWSFKQMEEKKKERKKQKQQRTHHTSILGKCVWKVPMLKGRVCKKQIRYLSVAVFFYSIIQALRICLTVSFLFWGQHFYLCWKRTSLVIFTRVHSVRIYSLPAMQRSISLRVPQCPTLLWTLISTYRIYIF